MCSRSETGALCVSAAAHTETRLQQNDAVERRGGTVCFKSEPKQQNTEERLNNEAPDDQSHY